MAKKLSVKQHVQDSMIYGAVMAGVKDPKNKKALVPGLRGMERKLSMCAIGSGNRGRKVTKVSDILLVETVVDQRNELIPLIRFATANDVSENYACGVNDGFENSMHASQKIYKWVDKSSLDYQRGWAVGQAVRMEVNER